MADVDDTQARQRRSRPSLRSPRRPGNPTPDPQPAPDDDGAVQGAQAAHPTPPSSVTPPMGVQVPPSQMPSSSHSLSGGPAIPPPPGAGRALAQPYATTMAADAPRLTFGQRVGRAFRRFLTWILMALFGLLLGVALFLFFPSLFNRAIRPVVENAAEIQRLQAEVDTLQARLTELEAEQRASGIEQQSALLDAQNATTGRLTSAEGRLADAEARLRDAEDRIAAQDAQLAELGAALDQVATQITTVEDALAELEGALPGVAEYAEYNRQLLLIRAWQDVLKVNLQLLQNNAGLAQQDLAQALDTLDRAYAVSSPEQQAALVPVIARLNQVAVDLSANPFAASRDLEVAWYDLGRLINPVAIGSTPTPTPLPTEEATPTPSP